MCPRVGVWTFCRYCAQEYGCKGCLKAGGELGWGPQSQRLLNQLERLYGSYEGARAAGWRWFARPSASTLAHKHQWWPPQQLCIADSLAKVPIGTTTAHELLWRWEDRIATSCQ